MNFREAILKAPVVPTIPLASTRAPPQVQAPKVQEEKAKREKPKRKFNAVVILDKEATL